MTKLAIKLFGYANAQTILTRPGDKTNWYSANDICRLLGIKGYSAAVHSINKKKSTYNLASSEYKLQTEYNGTSKRQFLLVNNVGMLKLVLKSKSDINSDIQKTALALFATIK
jgi:prophage antirepressor-like protein